MLIPVSKRQMQEICITAFSKRNNAELVRIYSLKQSYRCCVAVFFAFVVSGYDSFSHRRTPGYGRP